ncbi:MAG: CHAT domain-containing protein [Xenococcaceae cyanobacterium MO_167.B27]|nr:CHAT domain-containing protein [Xenococcaceae cyanobacterium MO_167.B27]
MISLVIVNYNQERYLGKAIASILEQTRRDWKLLIWDDGSTDNSVAIAREYQQQDDRIRVIAATHQGVAKARRNAIAETTGEYIGWVDSDDWIGDTALEETAKVLDSNSAIGMVYTDYYDVNSRGKVLGIGKRCNIPYSPQRLLVDFMTFHFRLLRREVYKQIGGINSNCEYAYDYDLCLRLSEVTKIERIEKPLYYYRHHGKNLTYCKRQEQIKSSKQAINQALQRRGLADTYVLKVEGARFSLHRKQNKVPLNQATLKTQVTTVATQSIFAPLAPHNWGQKSSQNLPNVGGYVHRGFRGQYSSSNLLKTAATFIAVLPFTAAITLNPASAQQIIPNDDGTMTVITKDGSTFNIDGGTLSGDGKNLFHSFQEFGLDAGQIANFLSNPNIQNILGRINGGNPSIINGLIQVTGGNSNLFLMNPSGIIFGNNASLNVPGDFTATTATGIGFGDSWFNAVGANDYLNLVGNPDSFNFANAESGVIINAGDLKVADDSNISLTGGTVINTGTIETEGGNITVAAVPGTKRVRISQEGQLLSLEIPIPQNAEGEALPIRVTDLPNLLRGLPVDIDTGLELAANDDVTVANSNTVIPNEPGTTIVSGTVDASNTQPGSVGGEAHLLGGKVGLIGADVDVSGDAGAGEVLVGGDYKGQGTVPNAEVTLVDSNSEIKADALQNGDGGEVIVWADNTTQFNGNISVRGGDASGNGGFVEVSGKNNLIFNGTVDASAPNGNVGELLLDPTFIVIVGSGYEDTTNLEDVDQFNDPDLDPTVSTTRIVNTAIDNAEADVTLQATVNITFSEPVNITNPGVGLTAQANNDINVNSDITTTGGNITLTGNADNIDAGAVTITNATVNADGGNITIDGTGGGGEVEINNFGIGIFNSQVTSANGNITLNGTGGGTGNLSDGIILNDSSTIQSTGTGNISLTGVGASGGQENSGIDIRGISAITSVDGDIVLNGTGGSGTITQNEGIILTGDSTIESTGNGTISLDGTGGAGTGNNHYGIVIGIDPSQEDTIGSNSRVTSVNGNITLNGTGGGTGNSNYGIFVNDGGTIESTETGNVSLTGIAGSDISGSENQGILIFSTNARVGSVDGNISLTGTGGNGTGGLNRGININSGAVVESTGNGNLSLVGTGGSGGDIQNPNEGILIQGTNSTVSSLNGNIDLEGNATGNNNPGIGLDDGGLVQSTGTGNISLTGTNADAEGILLSSGSIVGNSGAVTLTSDEINLFGTSTIEGTGTLQLQPLTPSLGITVGGITSDGRLNLDTSELNTTQNGFSQIFIGGEDGTGTLTIANNVFFLDPVTLQAGNIEVNGLLEGRGDASINLIGAGTTTTLNGDITTQGQPIEINDNLILGTGVTLNTTEEGFDGANITIDGTVNNDPDPESFPNSLTLTAGTGAINITGAIGDTNPIGFIDANSSSTTNFGSIVNADSLFTDAGGITILNGNVTTTDSQFYGDAVELGQNIELVGGGYGITFDSTVRSQGEPRSLTITTTGDQFIDEGITFNGAVGDNNQPLLSLETNTETGETSINGGSVTTTESQTYNTDVSIGNFTTDTQLIADSDNNETGNFSSQDIIGDGQNLFIQATTVTTGDIDSTFSVDVGDITLNSTNGNITTGSIEGGNILIDSNGENNDTQGLFTATATLPESNTSISGTTVTIEHGGGNTTPRTPFIVGDATTNGTAGDIVTSENVTAVTEFPDPFTSPNATIQILTTEDIPIVAANDGTGSVVTPQQDGVTFNITGGLTSDDNQNLFHSFTRFDLPESDQIANFIANESLDNILARVSSGNASDIQGTIQVTGGNANLFLINPAGVIFSETAQLNVPAAFTVTTGNGVSFGDNWFSASGDFNASILNGTPEAIALTMDSPGAIINNANLTNNNGALNLVGGQVSIQGNITTNGFSGVGQKEGASIVNLSDFTITSTDGITNLPNPFTASILTVNELAQLIDNNSSFSFASGISISTASVINSNGQNINLIGNTNDDGVGVSIFGDNINADGGNITITGTSQLDAGVAIDETNINADGGNITITGTSVADDGVFIRGQVTTSADGAINITGTSTEAIGILTLGTEASEGSPAIPTQITTASGEINLTGTSTNSLGVNTQNTDITSSNGAIAITGTSTNNTGIQLESTNVSTAINPDSPDTRITLTADTMELEADAEGVENNFTSNELVLQPQTPSRNINLEIDRNNPPANALNFANGRIAQLSQNVNSITIGRADGTGTITVTDDFNDGLIVESNLTLRSPESNGAIIINDEIETNGNDVTLNAGTSVNINQDITTDGGAIAITSGGTIDSSTVNLDSSSLNASGGDINLTATGNINLGGVDSSSTSESSEDKAGDVTITSTTGAIFVPPEASLPTLIANEKIIGIVADAIDGNGGNVTFSAAGDIQLFGIDSSSINGNGGDIFISSTAGAINATLPTPVSEGSTETVPFGLLLSGTTGQNGGNITLQAAENITTGFIYSGSLGTGTGGTISLNSTNGNIDTTVGANLEPITGGIIELPAGITPEIINTIFTGVSSLSQNNAGDINITANNGDITTSNIDAVSTTATGGEVTLNTASGNITPQNITTTNNNIDLNGAVTLAQDTTIRVNGTGDVNFANTVNGTQSLTVNTSGNTIFNDAVGATTRLSSLTTDEVGTTQVNGDVTTTEDQTYNDAVTLGTDTTLEGTNITANSTVDAASNGEQSLIVNASGNTIFNGEVGTTNALSSLTTNADGTTQLNGNVTTTGDQTYTANEVDISTGIDITGNTVILQPQDPALNIAIAPNTQSDNTLDITQAELDTIEANSIAIGNATDGSGTITVANPFTVDDPITLTTPSGTIQVNGQITGTDNASVTLDSSQTNLNSGITTEGDAITINSDVTLQNNVALSTISNQEAGEDININGSVNGANNLTLDAGSGNINIQGTMGTTENPLGDLQANSTGTTNFGGAINAASVTTNEGGTTTLNGNVTTTGNQSFNDNLTTSANIELNSSNGNITTQDITTSGNDLDINANSISTENITTQGGEVELESNQGAIATGDINTSGTAGGNINLDSATTIETGAINSSGTTENGGNVTLDSNSLGNTQVASGNITVDTIRADSATNGNGGGIRINADNDNPGLFVAAESFDLNGVDTSIFTNSSSAEAITIKHGGNGEIPFEVANPQLLQQDIPNGTVGAIIGGGNSQIEDGSFLFTEQRGNITIISVDEIDNNEIGNFDSESTSPIESVETAINNLPPKLAISSIPEARKTLLQIEQQAAQKPALVYISFTSPEIKAATSDPDEYFARAESCLTTEYRDALRLTGTQVEPKICLAAQPSDLLEILVVTAEGEPIYLPVDVTRAEVEKQAENLYREVANREELWQEPAELLYEWLIGSIEEELETREIDNLLFILPPKLRSLPLAALYDWENDQFVVEKGYNIGLAPSINLMNTIYNKNVQDAEVLALGASNFEPDQNQQALNAVEVEIPEIVNLRGGQVPIFNEQFTLENLQTTLDDNSFPIIHLSTHADFSTASIDDIYIQLYNQRLTLNELRSLDLKVGSTDLELLVLSACRSAFGDTNAELGFAGLAVKLGVKTAIGSLWKVSDVTTPGLMLEFYHQLKTSAFKAEALRLAQVAMIKEQIQIDLANRKMITSWGEVIDLPENVVADLLDNNITEIDLSHPYYWAPFTVIGSPW